MKGLRTRAARPTATGKIAPEKIAALTDQSSSAIRVPSQARTAQ